MKEREHEVHVKAPLMDLGNSSCVVYSMRFRGSWLDSCEIWGLIFQVWRLRFRLWHLQSFGAGNVALRTPGTRS